MMSLPEFAMKTLLFFSSIAIPQEFGKGILCSFWNSSSFDK